jgi:hypothetical protein
VKVWTKSQELHTEEMVTDMKGKNNNNRVPLMGKTLSNHKNPDTVRQVT